MSDQQYNLYVEVSHPRNQLVGYPSDFVTSKEFHRYVGSAKIPDKAISRLYHFEGRWEGGLAMYLSEGTIEASRDFSDRTFEDIKSELSSKMEMGMIREVAKKALFMDFDLYLGRERDNDITIGNRYVVLCSKPGELIDGALGPEYKKKFKVDFQKIGKVEKVPVGILMDQYRRIVDSVRCNKLNTPSQILIPHKSMFNHDCYRLGRYDYKH